MATSTGIMSATASLLAMTVLRMPLPACGTQGDREMVTHFSRGWDLTGTTPAASTAAVSSGSRLFGFCDNKDGSPVDPERTPGNVMVSVLCTRRKAGTLNLTQYERNTQGKKCIWTCCCKVPSDSWKLCFLKWHRQTEVWVSLRDCSHFGNDTSRLFEKFPLDVFTLSSFPKLSVKHKDTVQGWPLPWRAHHPPKLSKRNQWKYKVLTTKKKK